MVTRKVSFDSKRDKAQVSYYNFFYLRTYVSGQLNKLFSIFTCCIELLIMIN